MFGKEVAELLRRALREYGESGETWSMPVTQVVHHQNLVSPSSLGGCALRAAHQKLKHAPDLPELLPGENTPLASLFASGNAMAEMYQVAMLWQASRSEDLSVFVEQHIHDEMFAGRYDMLLNLHSVAPSTDKRYTAVNRVKVPVLIEIKYTKTPKVRKSYAFQLLAYRQMLAHQKIANPEALVMLLMSIHDDGQFTLFELKEEPGNGYMFYHTEGPNEGQPYDERNAVRWWNNPNHISQETLRHQHQVILDYMSGDRTKPPIDINGTEAWMCVNTDPKKKTITPSCPWALSCHGIDKPVLDIGF